MNTKGAHDRLQSGRHVAIAAEEHATAVGAALNARLAPRLGEGPAFSHERQIRALAAELRSEAELLKQADQRHVAELKDDIPLRDDRDTLAGQLREGVVRLRAVLRAGYGPAADKALVTTGETPTQPMELVRTARTLKANIGALAGLRPLVEYFSYDAAAHVAALEPLADQLADTLEKLDREGQQANRTRIEREKAIARYDDAFSEIAGALFGLFRLARERELAARVRPATGRRGVTARDAGEADVEEPEPIPVL